MKTRKQSYKSKNPVKRQHTQGWKCHDISNALTTAYPNQLENTCLFIIKALLFADFKGNIPTFSLILFKSGLVDLHSLPFNRSAEREKAINDQDHREGRSAPASEEPTFFREASAEAAQENPSLTDGFMDAVKRGPEVISAFIRATISDPTDQAQAFETMRAAAVKYEADLRALERKKAAVAHAEAIFVSGSKEKNPAVGRPRSGKLPALKFGISVPGEDVESMDSLRGTESRASWIADAIRRKSAQLRNG